MEFLALSGSVFRQTHGYKAIHFTVFRQTHGDKAIHFDKALAGPKLTLPEAIDCVRTLQ